MTELPPGNPIDRHDAVGGIPRVQRGTPVPSVDRTGGPVGRPSRPLDGVLGLVERVRSVRVPPGEGEEPFPGDALEPPAVGALARERVPRRPVGAYLARTDLEREAGVLEGVDPVVRGEDDQVGRSDGVPDDPVAGIRPARGGTPRRRRRVRSRGRQPSGRGRRGPTSAGAPRRASRGDRTSRGRRTARRDPCRRPGEPTRRRSRPFPGRAGGRRRRGDRSRSAARRPSATGRRRAASPRVRRRWPSRSAASTRFPSRGRT